MWPWPMSLLEVLYQENTKHAHYLKNKIKKIENNCLVLTEKGVFIENWFAHILYCLT